MAAGTPVIAYRAGGALDYVQPGITGEFFDEQSVESLVAALQQFSARDYDHNAIRQAAEKFSTDHFRHDLCRYLVSL
jgi:glycosyltransferase involved in cell wall biosynthesis